MVRPTIDKVRLIRRSMRCLLFGVIGLMPIFGFGLAMQTLRLRRTICAELEDYWKLPPLVWGWLAGGGLLWLVDAKIGVPSAFVTCAGLLVCQSIWVWRSIPHRSQAVWNPGRREVILGTILACDGLALSLWMLVFATEHLARLANNL